MESVSDVRGLEAALYGCHSLFEFGSTAVTSRDGLELNLVSPSVPLPKLSESSSMWSGPMSTRPGLLLVREGLRDDSADLVVFVVPEPGWR